MNSPLQARISKREIVLRVILTPSVFVSREEKCGGLWTSITTWSQSRAFAKSDFIYLRRGVCEKDTLKPHVCDSGSSSQVGFPIATQCVQRDMWRSRKYYFLLLQNHLHRRPSGTISLRKFRASDRPAIHLFPKYI